MRVLVGCTIPAYLMGGPPHWHHWLENALEVTQAALREHVDVGWLAVLQTDDLGSIPFAPLLTRVAELDSAVKLHWFSLELGLPDWASQRYTAICTGRNLIVDHAMREGYDWVYFADADISAPDDILPRLLELGYPVCGANVPTYCLDGPLARESLLGPVQRAGAKGDVRVHWNTAGSLLVRIDVAVACPWRWDLRAGDTDDPATQKMMTRLGYPPLVRHDVVCRHNPEAVRPVEQRGLDLRMTRQR